MRHRLRAGLLVCVFVAGFVGLVSVSSFPLGEIEEHFELGRQWRYTGVFPAVLRPPGYPGFVALTLLARDGIQGVPLVGACVRGVLGDDKAVALFVQRLLLVVTTGALFWFSSRTHGLFQAMCLATVFGCNPYSIILAGTLSYNWLHIVLMVWGTIALTLALERPDRSRLLVAGIVWGVATLVRPVSLMLPAFIAFLPLVRPGTWRTWTAVARFLGWFSFGMALAVAPSTIRNLVATGRVIPVNAQAGFGLWGNAIQKVPSRPGYLTWTVLWNEYGVPVVERVTGSAASRPESVEDAVRLNDEFTRLAFVRFREDPSIYAHNLWANFRAFNLDTMDVWVKFFQRAQIGVALGDVPDRPSNVVRVGAPTSPRA